MAEATATPAKMPGGLKITLIMIGVAVIAAGAFFVVQKIIWPKYELYQVSKQLNVEINDVNTESSEGEQSAESGAPNKKENREIGLTHVIKEFTVNTAGSNGMRFAIAEYVIESHDKKVIEEVKKREPQLRDEFIKYLRIRTANDILALDFQETSKVDLMKLINDQLKSGKIDNMYYTKLIVQ